MPELNENIAALVTETEQRQKCKYEPSKEDWKCNLAGSSQTLGDNLGNKPHATRESELSAGKWPSQAHHLIPHLQLADHPVKDWLKSGDLIYGDTKYNVDHTNNGLWMPYASDLVEWKGAGTNRKRELRFKVMEVSGMQIHQGAHSRRSTYGIGLVSYKARVDQYLDKIDEAAISHYKKPVDCADCKGKKQAGKVPPRHNTVGFVDSASRLLKKDIKQCIIFVSRAAAEYAETGGFDA